MPVRGLLVFFLSMFCYPAIAQTIRGEVLNMEDKQPVEGVTIENIYTSFDVSTDGRGAFLIAASSDQLLEFRKTGYKTVRVRIPKGFVPTYFRIIMQKGVQGFDLEHNDRYDYASDSARFHELYKHELDFPKLSTFDAIAHPFSALSGKNREIWRFQDDYDNFEKEKYVDRTFNETVVTKFTGLTGDSLRYYMRRFRPSYQQVRSMSEYAFYNYIRTTVTHYRNAVTPRNSQ